MERATVFLSHASYKQTHLVKIILFAVVAFNEGARDRYPGSDPNAERSEQLVDALEKGLFFLV